MFIIIVKKINQMGNNASECFPVNVGLRQGCVMSQWLFNVYIDCVVREVNVKVLGERAGVIKCK